MATRSGVVELVLFLTWAAAAQTGPTVVNTSYPSLAALAVAPGQIVRLEVTGLKTVLPAEARLQQAHSLPLPKSLAGISVTIRQMLQQSIMGPVTTVSYSAPMLSVSQAPLCSNGASPDCIATLLTIQVPYELVVAIVAPPIVRTELAVSENGVESQPFTVAAAADQIHVVTTCEGRTGIVCQSIVAHADGSLVTLASPARPGEVVVIYGWGFGQTTPTVKTGEATPVPAPTLSAPGHPLVFIRLDFSPNAAASDYLELAEGVPGYLTPGQVGLYQVNVQLPAAFPNVPPCTSFVRSNLTIDLVGQQSFDGAAICVAP